MAKGTTPKRGDARCSFCGKRQDQVRRLVAGPGVFICDQCIRLCNEIMNEPPPATPGEPASSTGKPGRPGRWLGRLFRFRAPASGGFGVIPQCRTSPNPLVISSTTAASS